MFPLNNKSSNQALGLAAKRALIHITGSEDTLKCLYLQPDRAVFLAENKRIILKVYMVGETLQREYDITQKVASIGVPVPKVIGFEAGQPAILATEHIIGHPLSSRDAVAAKEAGKYLQRIHTIGAHSPFSGGQQQWSTFISWWQHEEIEKLKNLNVLDHRQIIAFQEYFATLSPLLAQRPIVLLHGDLQTAHILVDLQAEHVLAFLDFADAQPGDPLLDIAVATLWDHALADLLLEGYSGIDNTQETQQLLSLYSLLRCIAEIPWLLERSFKKLAERNIAMLQSFLS